MIVTVLNFSGNTGKTTLCKNMLAPLLDADRHEIEKLNSGDGQADSERGARDFKNLTSTLFSSPRSAVVDIGSSEIAEMLKQFAKFEDTFSDIDFWVIPLTVAAKQRKDTLQTVAALIELGVEPGKIVVLPNNIADPETAIVDLENVYKLRQTGVFVAENMILESELFEILKDTDQNVIDLAGKETDFKKLRDEAIAAGDDAQLSAIGRARTLHQMAKSTARNLRAVFDETPLAKASAAA